MSEALPRPDHVAGVWRASPRFRAVASAIEVRIRAGEYPIGTVLPSVASLAREFGVARGTVERALARLENESRLVSPLGRRWYVHAATRSQSLSVVRSFGQWALASGMTPSGRFVEVARGRATGVEARELGGRRGDPVLRVVRVRALDRVPVMVEHTTFPSWLAATIESLPVDARSIMEVVEREHRVPLGHAEHRIEAIAASAMDGRLLGVSRGTPVLRVLRTVRFVDGRAFEYSDDRYLPGMVSFSQVTTSPSPAG
ncbi:GntR family transcriptional regulator [Actinopolymorpha alba]|uniref:GntR family transcriptional regulator n=1 Tax=Actinopolymorpha alba TaxID=533267 RepID=UPI0003744E6F|nr:GntR family transcriptional regulator [Actinopolymorpha alba]